MTCFLGVLTHLIFAMLVLVIVPKEVLCQLQPQPGTRDCGRRGAAFRILRGQESILGAWPWMAVVYAIRNGRRIPDCGGVLITPSHVLTAGHCTTQVSGPSQLLVRLGELNLDSDADGANPIDVPVQSILVHERFDFRTFQNDIAILVLVRSVDTSDQIAPICLPFALVGENLVNRYATAIGWGATSPDEYGTSTLQEVQIRIWDNAMCREIFRSDVPITASNLCAGHGVGDACRGDSGGPLMLADANEQFYLIGLVSFGKGCGQPGIPGVYTRVTTFLDWIQEKIGRQ